MELVRCVDGPWEGWHLFLSSNRTTAWFTLRGVIGRYAYGRWTVKQ